MKSKLLFVVFVILVSGLAFAAPALAMDDSMCHHDTMPMTIESLQKCVEHAVAMGHITNAQWANSLQSQLAAAQAALDRGQAGVTINILNAFINEVEAQSGKLILDPHGAHLIMHAQMVIEALSMPGM